MKILLVQHYGFINGSGGTEKICCFLANYFSSLGHEVEIATNQNISGGGAIYPLKSEVRLINIYNPDTPQKEKQAVFNYKGKNPFLWIKYKLQKKVNKAKNRKLLKENGGEEHWYKLNLLHRAKAWKSFIDKSNPNIIITMSIGSLLEISYKNKYHIPIINSTNGRPDYDYTDILWYRSNFEMKLLKNSFKQLSGIQILFEDYKAYLPCTFFGKSVTITNPVPQVTENESAFHTEKARYKIINIASLVTSCKQQHLTIKIFEKLSKKYPNWDLHFWGTGIDYKILETIIKDFKLKNRVFLNGFTPNPLAKMKDADIFIFPSKYEGFPLALTEAMAVGLPCIGLAQCSGVNQLIYNDYNGYLVENEKEMIEKTEKLMSNHKLRNQMGKNALLSVQKFHPDTVKKKWSSFIEEIFNNKNKIY